MEWLRQQDRRVWAWWTSNIRILQWGKVERERPGLKNHEYWQDEPDRVPFTDYKYWIRFYPNPGFNIPFLGYWSSDGGKHRTRKV